MSQFVAHVRARVEPAEEAVARRALDDEAWRLFSLMPVADRRHALDVVARLAEAGHDDRDLVIAALLHDAAKGNRMRLWHRIAGVLLDAFAPGLLRRLAHPDPRSWRHPFHLYLNHGPMSADLAEAVGCSPRAVAFMRGTSAGRDVRLMHALRVADDAS